MKIISLTRFIKSKAGRNSAGRITVRSRWCGHKRRYRLIDFRGYDKLNIPAKVVSIEYDPNRTCRIALLNYVDWEKRYVLAWKWIAVWDQIMCWDEALFKPWNRKQLKDIPDSFNVFNLEFTPFTKGKIVRSAWQFAKIMGKEESKWLVYIKMPSWEVRKFNNRCWATIWNVWNEEKALVVVWKAWRSRWMWKRPHVLWKSMNPVDHPHGWWEWHASVGLKKWPKSFTGRIVAPWIKTRRKRKRSDKFIVSRRWKKK